MTPEQKAAEEAKDLRDEVNRLRQDLCWIATQCAMDRENSDLGRRIQDRCEEILKE